MPKSDLPGLTYQVSHTPGSAELMRDALPVFRRGDLRRAGEMYRHVLELDPGNAEAHNMLGVIALQTGHYRVAAEFTGRAVQLAPRSAGAHSNLGIALRHLGKEEAAESALRRALEIDPGHLEARFNLALILTARRDGPGAVQALRIVLEADPGHVDAANMLSKLYLDFGSWDEAKDVISAAAARHPRSAEAWLQLGYVCGESGDAAGARANFRKALEAATGSAAELNRMGNWLQAQGHSEEAEAAFRTALSRHPRLADLENNLGTVCQSRGRFAEAESAYRRALQLRPGFAAALKNLSDSRKITAADGELLSELERRLADPPAEAAERMQLHFALGKVYNDLGRYGEAIRQFTLGNALRPDGGYDPAIQENSVRNLMKVFNRALFSAPPFPGNESELPIFIIGMPRSGTTLLEQILASHPQVYGAGEVVYFNRMPGVIALHCGPGEVYPQCIRDLGSGAAEGIAEGYLRSLKGRGADRERVTDKMPYNFLHLGLIRLLFPRARILHCRRDPYDNCLSIYTTLFTVSHPYAGNLAHVAHAYRSYRELMGHWRKVLTGGFLEVAYEDLVEDLEEQTGRILAYLDLPWDDACLAFHRSTRAVPTASNWQVRQPVYTGSRGRWRNYEMHLGPLFEVLGPPE